MTFSHPVAQASKQWAMVKQAPNLVQTIIDVSACALKNKMEKCKGCGYAGGDLNLVRQGFNTSLDCSNRD